MKRLASAASKDTAGAVDVEGCLAMYSTGLAEIVLIVKDVRAAARFYRDVVGLMPETEADDAWAWFWAGQPGHRQRVALHKGTLLFEEQAQQIIHCINEPLLFARVDGIERDGELVLMELEVIEPFLFLETNPQAIERFARAILTIVPNP